MRSQAFSTSLLVAGVLVLAVALPWLTRELGSIRLGPMPDARAGERRVTLEIDGMTCGGCAAKVEQRLTAVPGVTVADVRHRSGKAYVVCRRELSDAALTAAVSGTGAAFTARVVPR